MDVLLFTAEKGYSTIDRLTHGIASKKSYYKPKINRRVNIHPQLLVDIERILNESDQPIIDLHTMLVPTSMGNGYFTSHIGNRVTQAGRVRETTRARIIDWIELQRHELESGMFQ